jgi:hypothetical protein
MIDPVEFGKSIAAIVKEATAPLQRRIEELEARAVEEREPGPKGDDAEPVLVSDVVAELVKSDMLAPVLDLYVEERVAEHFKANPVQHGKDGEPGPKGDDGKKGDPGRDGLDVKDMFRADGGRLVAVLSDGTTRDLGQFVGKDGDDGKDGRDGADGLGFDDCDVEVKGREVVLTYSRGELQKSVSYPVPTFEHIGFWGQGKSAKVGQFTTHDGCLWLALRDTKESPTHQSSDWQLSARKGVDGKAGKDGNPPRSGPVNLGDKPDA